MTARIFFADSVRNAAYKAYAASAAYRRATIQQSMRFGAPAALNLPGGVCAGGGKLAMPAVAGAC